MVENSFLRRHGIVMLKILFLFLFLYGAFLSYKSFVNDNDFATTIMLTCALAIISVLVVLSRPVYSKRENSFYLDRKEPVIVFSKQENRVFSVVFTVIIVFFFLPVNIAKSDEHLFLKNGAYTKELSFLYLFQKVNITTLDFDSKKKKVKNAIYKIPIVLNVERYGFFIAKDYTVEGNINHRHSKINLMFTIVLNKEYALGIRNINIAEGKDIGIELIDSFMKLIKGFDDEKVKTFNHSSNIIHFIKNKKSYGSKDHIDPVVSISVKIIKIT